MMHHLGGETLRNFCQYYVPSDVNLLEANTLCVQDRGRKQLQRCFQTCSDLSAYKLLLLLRCSALLLSGALMVSA